MPCWDHKKADAFRAGLFSVPFVFPPRRFAAVPQGTWRPPLRSRPASPLLRLPLEVSLTLRCGADAPSLRSNAPVSRQFTCFGNEIAVFIPVWWFLLDSGMEMRFSFPFDGPFWFSGLKMRFWGPFRCFSCQMGPESPFPGPSVRLFRVDGM